MEAVLVEFPPVDLAVLVGVHLVEELLEVTLHHFPIEEPMTLQLFSHPRLQFATFEDVVTVGVVLEEDVLHEVLAEVVHNMIR